MSVAENLKRILSEIRSAERSSARNEGDVKLVAVSKTKSLELIDEAASAGQKIFGENYVQEVVAKIKDRPDLEWHFIGSLQTNKVKDIVGIVPLIHSVDRMKLAREISKEAVKKEITQEILLQLQVGDESTKQGFSEQELIECFIEIASLPGVRVRGLMSLPPLSTDFAVSQSYFREVREMHETLSPMLSKADQAKFNILSMGTTHDFKPAIAEGATHVRIGTAVFGARRGGTDVK
jgi:pyridoxal phosphate enzyme (YggS family)